MLSYEKSERYIPCFSTTPNHEDAVVTCVFPEKITKGILEVPVIQFKVEEEADFGDYMSFILQMLHPMGKDRPHTGECRVRLSKAERPGQVPLLPGSEGDTVYMNDMYVSPLDCELFMSKNCFLIHCCQ